MMTRIRADSTSGKSIGSSKKAKHIEFKHLFAQQLVQNEILSIHKVGALDNLADIFTKYIAEQTHSEDTVTVLAYTASARATPATT